MIYLMNISMMISYVVLMASAILVIWSLRNKGPGRNLGTAVGAVVMVLVIASLYMVIDFGVKYWAQGDFDHASPMHMGQGMQGMQMPMMDKMGHVEMPKK